MCCPHRCWLDNVGWTCGLTAHMRCGGATLEGFDHRLCSTYLEEEEKNV